MSTSAIIKCRELRKSYFLSDIEVPALRGIDLDIAHGEMVAIMGHSGSGKSTLMNIIGCMDRPTAGSYLLDDVDVNELNNRELALLRNRKMGFVFQRYNLIPRCSALYNVELPLFYSGLTGKEVKDRAMEALEQVGLLEYVDHWPNQMSGGQQQRVAIARAVVNNPMVILADEPTGALDTASSNEVMRLFQLMHRERGVTVVVVTHEPSIADFCQRRVLLRDGMLVDHEADLTNYDSGLGGGMSECKADHAG